MDWHEVAIGLLGVLSVSYGWFLSKIVSDQRALEHSMAEFKAEVPEKYVAKRDDDRRWDQIIKTLDRIESKLDGKADKPS
jgi:hypothetical protein